MEAMAVGLPVICSKIRGNVDLIDNDKGGLLFLSNDKDECALCIEKLITNEKKRNVYKTYNLDKIKKFDKSTVILLMRKIFNK